MKSYWLWGILIILGGCGNWQPRPQTQSIPAAYSKYQFDYNVTNGEPIELVRVFDDGSSTYFQFRREPPSALVISSETSTGEAIIPHKAMGNYAVIRGVYRESTIPAAALKVTVQKLGAISPMANIGPVILPKATKESASKAQTAALPVAINNAINESGAQLQIRFRRNSALLSQTGRKALTDMVVNLASVGQVEIRVRPFYPAKRASVRLAEARAKVIRNALIEFGFLERDIRTSTDGGRTALLAEIAFHAKSSQASAGTMSVRTGLAQERLPIDVTKPTLPSPPI